MRKLDLFFWTEKRVPVSNFTKSIVYPFASDEYIMVRARIDKSLQLLCIGLAPYMQRELSLSSELLKRHNRFAKRYIEKNNLKNVYKDRDIDEWDSSFILNAIQNLNYNIFNILDDSSIIRSLLEYRNHWAHPNPFYRFTEKEKQDMRTMFQSIVKLLNAVKAYPQSEQISDMIQEIDKI